MTICYRDRAPLWYFCLSSCSSWWRLFSTEVILLLSLVSMCFSRSASLVMEKSCRVSNRSTRASRACNRSSNLLSASHLNQNTRRHYRIVLLMYRLIKASPSSSVSQGANMLEALLPRHLFYWISTFQLSTLALMSHSTMCDWKQDSLHQQAP